MAMRGIDSSEAEDIGRRVMARFDRPWLLGTGEEQTYLFATPAVAIVELDAMGASQSELLGILFRTLSASRIQSGVALYNETLDREVHDQLRMEEALERCIRQEGMEGFALHYQPIVNAVTGKWCGLEALCRWNAPWNGAVPPDTFIPVVERMGLIHPLSHWVTNLAVAQCKEWGLDTLEDFVLNINVSPIQMRDPLMVERVREVLERYSYPSTKLALEITEGTEFRFDAQEEAVIEGLQRLGVAVVLDDFGTGYSTFGRLRKLPVEILKTERTMIENIENDSYNQYLLQVVVELAHAANIKVVAEGVETQREQEVLADKGVDFMQGFLFSKPLTPGELSGKLHMFTA